MVTAALNFHYFGGKFRHFVFTLGGGTPYHHTAVILERCNGVAAAGNSGNVERRFKGNLGCGGRSIIIAANHAAVVGQKDIGGIGQCRIHHMTVQFGSFIRKIGKVFVAPENRAIVIGDHQ